MRPILLKGHERSITMVKYNREGDLLFSTAKDHHPTVWYSDNGERIGTYEGHQGAVWACDISSNSSLLVTASADTTAKLWDVQSGKELFTFSHHGPVRSSNFSIGDKMLLTCADPFMEKPASVCVYDLLPENDFANQRSTPRLCLTDHGHKGKITGAYWMPFNEAIMTTGSDGTIKLFHPETGKLISEHVIHTADITGVDFNKERTICITSSKDNTSKLLDVETLEVLKTYETDRPVNSASISPLKEHVVLGGGQEAMSVTTTSGRVGKFEARFFHMIYQEEFGRVKGHFGPINTITFSPDGKSYASGAEDGYIRLHFFDPEYLDKE